MKQTIVNQQNGGSVFYEFDLTEVLMGKFHSPYRQNRNYQNLTRHPNIHTLNGKFLVQRI